MTESKNDLGELDVRDEVSAGEVEASLENCIGTLRESGDEVDVFVEKEVIPALNEIKAELKEQFLRVSLDYPVSDDISLAATITMAWEGELPEPSQCPEEVEYRVELGRLTKKAKGSLVMKDVLPGSADGSDLVLGELEIDGSGETGDAVGITRADITGNFTQLYEACVNQPSAQTAEQPAG